MHWCFNQSYSIAIHGCFKDNEWIQALMDKIRARYTHYQIGLIYIKTSLEKIIERICHREKGEESRVPMEVIQKTDQKVSICVNKYKAQMDNYIEIEN